MYLEFEFRNKINPNLQDISYSDVKDVLKNSQIPGIRTTNSDNGFVVDCGDGCQLNVSDNNGHALVTFRHHNVPPRTHLKRIMRILEDAADILDCKIIPRMNSDAEQTYRKYLIKALTIHKEDEPRGFSQDDIEETDAIWNSMTPRQKKKAMRDREMDWGFRKSKRVKPTATRKPKKVIKKCKCK